MKVEQIYTGCLAEAAYYIESEGEAVIIDPLRETKLMEKGEYRVSLDNLFKILAVFEVSFDDFFSNADAAEEPGRALSREDMQILHLVRQLSDEGRREAMEFLEFKVRREQQDRRAVESRRRNRRTGS